MMVNAAGSSAALELCSFPTVVVLSPSILPLVANVCLCVTVSDH